MLPQFQLTRTSIKSPSKSLQSPKLIREADLYFVSATLKIWLQDSEIKNDLGAFWTLQDFYLKGKLPLSSTHATSLLKDVAQYLPNGKNSQGTLYNNTDRNCLSPRPYSDDREQESIYHIKGRIHPRYNNNYHALCPEKTRPVDLYWNNFSKEDCNQLIKSKNVTGFRFLLLPDTGASQFICIYFLFFLALILEFLKSGKIL